MTFPRLPLFPWTAAVTLSRDEARRLLNVVIATLALLFALPVMVAIAVLIKLTSRGPVLFAQRRIGLDRRRLGNARGDPLRHFYHGGLSVSMYKFLSVYVKGQRAPAESGRPGHPAVDAALS